MKKLISLILTLLMMTAVVNAGAVEAEIDLYEYYPEFWAYAEDFGGTEPCYYNEDVECWKLTTDSVVVFCHAIDSIDVYTSADVDNPELAFTPADGELPSTGTCTLTYTSAERQDNGTTYPYCDEAEGTYKYIESGAQLQFNTPGHYFVNSCIGFETAEERVAFEKKFPETEYPHESFFCVIVSGDEIESAPTEDADNEDFFKVPSEYDENLISISGISHIEYERPTVEYHDRVAVCTAPVTIEVKQDLAMFTIVPVRNENGTYILDEEAAEFDYWEFDPAYGGDVIPAKKGKTVTLTEPGLYTVFAEKTYMGDWTELVIEIPGEAPAKPAEASGYNALYTASKVMVDGKEVQFEAYNIADNNYFKLRDIALVLSGTSKQFEVTWDEANKRVNMMSGAPYTAVGGELAAGDGTAKTATDGTSNIGKDGSAVSLKAYLINGNNYFKLRDLGKLFNFGVSWDGANNCVLIDSENSYTE